MVSPLRLRFENTKFSNSHFSSTFELMNALCAPIATFMSFSIALPKGLGEIGMLK